MSFDDDLNAAIDRDWMDLDVALNGVAYKLRFTAMDGLEWADQCDKHPIREDVGLDSRYGYDLRSLTKDAAPLCGVRVVGDTTEALTPAQWETFFSRIDGQTFRRIGDVLWGLNEFIPEQEIVAAKKALAASEKTLRQPSNSASPRKGSTAGSRKKPPSTSTKTGA